MQLYVYWKLRGAMPARGPWRGLAIGWLVGVGAAFFLSRVFEALGWRLAATAAGLVSHWWVAATMWFVGMCLAADGWNLAVRLSGRAWPGAARLRIPRRALAVAVAAVVVALSVWGFVEPWGVRLETVVVHAPQLPAGSKPIRVVQVSDLHLNALMSRGRLARIVRRIREAKPDLLVFTGDFADQSSGHVDALAALLAEVHTPLGKLAATGNHEFYRPTAQSLAPMEAAGFRVLHNRCVPVAPGLTVAGVHDYAAERLGLMEEEEEDRVLPARRGSAFVLLLKHRPYVEARSVGRFDLQLSGHIHGGQVFPARWLLRLFSRHIAGRYDVGSGSALYVSRGAGTFGVPMRLLSPPEITLIILQPPP
jgi:predicted MPP superfamily phosphohydrolase